MSENPISEVSGTSIYESFLRNLAYPMKQRLTGGQTLAHLKELDHSQWLPPEELQALQWKKLQELLSFAYQNCPYYGESFSKLGFTPSDIQQPQDFQRLPVLSKADIRENVDGMIAPSQRDHLIPIRTGGSTGEPLKVYLNRGAYQFRNAIEMRSMSWWGIRVGDRTVNLWGDSRGLNPSRRGRIKGHLASAWSRFFNERRISAYHMSEEDMGHYVTGIQNFRPRLLYSYTTSAYRLAQFILESNINMQDAGLKAVVCTAEPVYPFQRKAIEDAFCCPVVNEYGSTEGGVYAFQCPSGRMHLAVENAYVEFLKDGQPVGPGELGEIAVTTLSNQACPLIRYNLGDIGSFSLETCPCGRGLPLLSSVEGRQHDTIVLADGRAVHGEMFTHIMDYAQGIARFKVIQKTSQSFDLLVVATSGFEPRSLEIATDKMKEMLGDGVNIDVHMRDDIPLDKSGKFRWIVSNVNQSAPPN